MCVCVCVRATVYACVNSPVGVNSPVCVRRCTECVCVHELTRMRATVCVYACDGVCVCVRELTSVRATVCVCA